MTVKKSAPPQKITKKTITKEVQAKIADVLLEYKSSFDPKELEGKLKKAAKLFSGDILKKVKAKERKTPLKKKAAVKK